MKLMGDKLGTVADVDVAAWAAPTGYGGGLARRLGCRSGAARACGGAYAESARALQAWMAPGSPAKTEHAVASVVVVR